MLIFRFSPSPTPSITVTETVIVPTSIPTPVITTPADTLSWAGMFEGFIGALIGALVSVLITMWLVSNEAKARKSADEAALVAREQIERFERDLRLEERRRDQAEKFATTLRSGGFEFFSLKIDTPPHMLERFNAHVTRIITRISYAADPLTTPRKNDAHLKFRQWLRVALNELVDRSIMELRRFADSSQDDREAWKERVFLSITLLQINVSRWTASPDTWIPISEEEWKINESKVILEYQKSRLLDMPQGHEPPSHEGWLAPQ